MSRKLFSYLLPLSGFYLICLVYANHFQNTFHFDDFHSVVNNPAIRNLNNWYNFFLDGKLFSILPSNQSYRPLTTLSLAIDYRLGQYAPFYYHFSTFILFTALVGSLLALLKILILHLKNSYANTALFVFTVLFFAIHPATGETVNYIIARSEIQSGIGVTLGLYIYIRFPDLRKYCLYLLPVILGALTKPTALMFYPILFSYLAIYEGNGFANLNTLKTAFKKSIPALITFILIYAFIEKMTPEAWQPGGTSRIDYLITQPYVISHYFFSFFAPVGLSADTDWGLIGIHNPKFWLGLLFIVLVLLFLFKFSGYPRYKGTTFGLSWFLLALLPTSSIIPLAEVINDHRMFFPFIGLSIALANELFYIIQNKKESWFAGLVFSFLLLVLGFEGYWTYNRNKIWLSEKSLWKNVTEVSPKNARGIMNYGVVLLNEGNFTQALKYFKKAQAMAPNYANLWINSGIARAALFQYNLAEQDFIKALALSPDYTSYFFYGRFLFQQGRNEQAARMLEISLAKSTMSLDTRYLLLDTYSKLKDKNRFNTLASETLNISPSDSYVLQAIKQF